MTDNQSVSIIMSVYNEENHILECMESILNQTYSCFECIIIDDASTDRTAELLSEIRDSRIKVYYNKKNRGLTVNLNRAMTLAKGKYIVRMDADDIATSDRIGRQVLFMEQHPEVALASCGYKEIGIRSSVYQGQSQWTSDRIKAMLLFHSVLPHPGFIFNKAMIERYGIAYEPKLKYAQDYLFQSNVSHYYEIAFMPDILLKYRVSPKQVSISKREEQAMCANVTRMKQLKWLGIQRLPVPIEVWESFCMNRVLGQNKYSSLILISLLVFQIIYKSGEKLLPMGKTSLYHEIKRESLSKLKLFWKHNLFF